MSENKSGLKKVSVWFVRYDDFLSEPYAVAVYALSDGHYINIQHSRYGYPLPMGLVDALRANGYEMLNDPVPVHQFGRLIGTVPGNFHPGMIKSRSFFYEPRHGDFIRKKYHWEASPTLGSGDLDAIPGFIRSREELC